MKNSFFDKFSLLQEKEDTSIVIDNIERGVVFRGTNLWVLIFAIFIASLGLNVNSTAVIIGAMLISPLMGPIMGIGLSVGIHDLGMLRKSIYNYLVATGVALATSTLFFLLSPLDDAHSEILARTSPNIYDVLIALFGGLAGIIANSSKNKGNVIPGVAIATALMPPLCTAGYGLASLKFNFFFGAFYLFWINTVFIALATFLAARFLKFPYHRLPDEIADRKANRIIWSVVIVTLIPSLYFGYNLVQQDKFNREANRFIDAEAHFTNDYLLSRKVDAKTKSITLTYGGQEITKADITTLKSRIKNYRLKGAQLQIHQGFAYLTEAANSKEDDPQTLQLRNLLQSKEMALQQIQFRLDSIKNFSMLSAQIHRELKVNYPKLKSTIIQPVTLIVDSSSINSVFLAVLNMPGRINNTEQKRIGDWLKTRLNQQDLRLIFENR